VSGGKLLQGSPALVENSAGSGFATQRRWPIGTPVREVRLSPQVTAAAARAYGFDLKYQSKPAWVTYAGALEFANQLRRDLADLRPRELIDIQSFFWDPGSAGYGEQAPFDRRSSVPERESRGQFHQLQHFVNVDVDAAQHDFDGLVVRLTG
jgi:hypothetical protein